MKIRKTALNTFLILVTMAAIQKTLAASVVWDTPTTIANNSDGSEILNTGNYEFGWTVNSTATSDVTVNGVLFLADGSTNPTSSTVTGNITASSIAGDNDNSKVPGSAYTNPDLTELLSLGILSNPLEAGSTFTLNLDGLTVNTEYRVQLMGGQLGISDSRGFNVTSGGIVSSTVAAANVNVASIVATFTADSTSQSFIFTSTDNRAPLNAVSVFAIPEPATIATFLGFFTLLATFLVRKRKQH